MTLTAWHLHITLSSKRIESLCTFFDFSQTTITRLQDVVANCPESIMCGTVTERGDYVINCSFNPGFAMHTALPLSSQ